MSAYSFPVSNFYVQHSEGFDNPAECQVFASQRRFALSTYFFSLLFFFQDLIFLEGVSFINCEVMIRVVLPTFLFAVSLFIMWEGKGKKGTDITRPLL